MLRPQDIAAMNMNKETNNKKRKTGKAFFRLKKLDFLCVKSLRCGLGAVTIVTSLLMAVSCSSIDCPMNSLVYTQYQLLDGDGNAYVLRDTLTVSTARNAGNDSVLINKDVNVKAFDLPVSYANECDVFYFELRDSLGNAPLTDTVTVVKDNMPHFESADCPPSFFHKITAVNATRNAIDSIAINNPDVNYDTSKKHINIYFRHRN